MGDTTRESKEQLQKYLSALQRAAKRAEAVSLATGTPLIVWENGRVVEHYPEPARAHPDSLEHLT